MPYDGLLTRAETASGAWKSDPYIPPLSCDDASANGMRSSWAPCALSRVLTLEDENGRFEEFKGFKEFGDGQSRFFKPFSLARRRNSWPVLETRGQVKRPLPHIFPCQVELESWTCGGRPMQADTNRRAFTGHSKTPTSSALAREPRRRLLASCFRDCSRPRLAVVNVHPPCRCVNTHLSKC